MNQLRGVERMRKAVKDGHQLKQTSSIVKLAKPEKVQKDKAKDR
jgi:hypothetical protein